MKHKTNDTITIVQLMKRWHGNSYTQANSAFHPSGVGKWEPASAEEEKAAGMVHAVSGWTHAVQVKLWNPLRTRAIPERLRGVFTMYKSTFTLPHLKTGRGWSARVHDTEATTTPYDTVCMCVQMLTSWQPSLPHNVKI